MLAYTTISDLIHLPSALEVTVYMAGFVAVLTLPTIVFGIIDSRAAKASRRNRAEQKRSLGL